MTNTNLQHYSGESGLSYLSQMLVIIFMMFVSASTGYAACVAFCRGLTGTSKNNLGNFYVDLVRITTRILIPLLHYRDTDPGVAGRSPRISWPTRR